MKFLLLNQAFYPDVMASGQYLAEVATTLAERGHTVTVLTSRRAYDEPARQFAKEETWRGVLILRVGGTGFGKTSRWRRAADFASFLFCCAWRLAFLPGPDAVVALSSPPLIAFLGACLAKARRSRFLYWVLDLNPDEAIAAGWLRADSVAAKLLERMSRWSLRQADAVIALDRFMRARIVGKGIAPRKVAVVSPWSQDGHVRFDPAGRERFRWTHGLDGKFVVMYSGNHSPCHPLQTLREAAERLAAEREIVFCFIGGGSEWRKMQQQARRPRSNLKWLPYQPWDHLSASLSAADLHVVVMGDQFVGLVHPSKIYNILRVGAPVLYVGPAPSHVTELFRGPNGEQAPNQPGMATVAQGDVEGAVREILRLRRESRDGQRRWFGTVATRFSRAAVLPELVDLLEGGEPGAEAKGCQSMDREGLLVP